MTLPLDPFGRTTLPDELREQFDAARAEEAERERRVRMVADVAYASEPSPDALLFVKGSLQAFLEAGGDLDDYLRLRPPRGSHSTASALWKRMRSSSR